MILQFKIPPAYQGKLTRQVMDDLSQILICTKEFWYGYQRIGGRFDTKQY